jgi:transcriptional regulator of heat shock response
MQGLNLSDKTDEELIPYYKSIFNASLQEEKAREIQREKSRIAAQRSQEQAEHVARLRAQGVKNEETMRFSPEMRYHEGRKQLIESTGNAHNPMLRGVTLNGNTDTSFESSM